jgi:phage shock protein C
MYCTKCGIELNESNRFCSGCGTRTSSGTAFTPAPGRPLLLDKRNKKVAGVCAGFARYFDMDVVLMRVLWLAVALCSGGIGFLVYLGAWIVIPSDNGLEVREMAFPHAPAN